MRDGYLHDKNINSIEKYLEENTELKKAIRISLKKYKHHLEEIMEERVDDVTDDEEEDEDSGEEGSEEEDSNANI